MQTQSLFLEIARTTPVFTSAEAQLRLRRSGLDTTIDEIRLGLREHGYSDLGNDHWTLPKAEYQARYEAAQRDADRLEACLRACLRRLGALVATGRASAAEWARETKKAEAALASLGRPVP
jgi:hypothetical protein